MASPDRSAKTGSDEKPQSVPSISLPKGGGAIQGIGEKFAANPVTGTGSMTIPLAASPGRSGFGPQLSLSYDSGSGNGPFGFGWSLTLSAITRKTEKGLPRYFDGDESDTFILSGTEDLVPMLDPGGKRHRDDVSAAGYVIERYRPRVEGLFARIERWTRQKDGDVHWRSTSKDNVLALYGVDAESRVADPDDPRRIFSWLICEARDDKGNAILYGYRSEDGIGCDLARACERNRGNLNDPRRSSNRYLKRIRYGNRAPLLDNGGGRPRFLEDLPAAQLNNAGWMFETVFDYGEHDADAPAPDDKGAWAYRDDPFSSYRSGFEVRTTRLCRRVLMFHHIPDLATGAGYDGLVRSTDFTYSHQQDPAAARNPVYTFLREVRQTGYRRRPGGGYDKGHTPPVEFEYSEPVVQEAVEEVDAAALENLPIGVDGTDYRWTDLHGDGIPGILAEQAGAFFYKRNLSPLGDGAVAFGPMKRVPEKPNLTLAGERAQFIDLGGDGQSDLVVLEGPGPGYYEHDDDEGWKPFRPFVSALRRDMRDANLRFVDLDGDGRADVLITEDDALVWHPSLGEAGFGEVRRVVHPLDDEQGPRLVFADATQAIYLADFSGDGLTDLVRIRNGDICYWPNFGYGRFGAKVAMDRAPHFDNPDQFRQSRIRLADIDGSGTTDIVYLHRHGVRLYFNQSGNAWSASRPLKAFPQADDMTSLAVADLLGNGTACLVWSSRQKGDYARPMRFVNLMGAHKPHLLIRMVNNLGAETSIRYAPSTKFYLQDERDGRPWLTRLAFPVHVVERVETIDHVSRSRFAARYAYHHGYYDGVEREFRGFAMVEQWDTEALAALAGNDVLPLASNLDAASHVPPVLTRTWFHTGACFGRDHISDFFAGPPGGHDKGEYYRPPGLTDAEARALLLDDSVLPPGLTADEAREACRALKGSMLRQENYALDGTARQAHPYSVVEKSFIIRLEQPRGENRHAAFFVAPREILTFHYERNASDPRVQHALTLEVDSFGNVLKAAAVGYGRKPELALSSPGDRNRQTATWITCVESRVTLPIDGTGPFPDAYRAPMPCETRSYELTGYSPTGPAGRFRDADFIKVAGGKTVHIFDGEIAYQEVPGFGRQRRLIEHVRTLYRADELTNLLPLGETGALALPGESYKLAFTAGLLSKVFARDGEPLVPNPAVDIGGQGGDRGGYLSSQMLKADGRFPASDPDDHWWIPSGRIFLSDDPADIAAAELAHAQRHFFLARRFRDPFHSPGFNTESIVTYDSFDLLAIETRDALGNRITVGLRKADGTIDPTAPASDYRLLQPHMVTDPNRNRTAVAFDVLGMVVGTAIMGKEEEDAGDSLVGFVADLAEAAILGHFADPLADPASLLGAATTRLIYDLFAYRRSKSGPKPQPAAVCMLERETHDAELGPGEESRIRSSLSYSDGFGREIQKKVQAEPGPVAAGGPVADPRWVGSGWTVFNNKGKPVRQYEPFFSPTHGFEFGVKVGVSPILFYDPAERVVATLHPNHSWEKQVFAPWRQESWDVNDTVLAADPKTDPDVGGYFARLPDADYLPGWHALRTDAAQAAALAARYPDPIDRANEARTAAKTAIHAGTPTIAHADSLGRTFLVIAHNRLRYSNMPATAPAAETFHATRTLLDIEGNQREIVDAMDRVVMRYAYDMLGNRIHQASMEAGERWMVNDVSGKPLYVWDSRGHRVRTAYDALRRPTEVFLTEVAGPEILVARSIYGESLPGPAARNLRGALAEHHDQAGIATSDEYDFKGNLLRSSSRLAQSYKTQLDWSGPVPLEPETYSSRTRYDALDRPIQTVALHSDQAGAGVNFVQPVYNLAGLLEQVHVWLDHPAEPAALLSPAGATLRAVTDIDYDAKGQRLRIDRGMADGNVVRTRYGYDPETFRLTHMYTRRRVDPATGLASGFAFDCENPAPPPATMVAPDPPPPGAGCGLQNLHYSYDPAGNITHISDLAQQTVYFRNTRVEPSADYTYDALYRLIEATGREHLGQIAGSPILHGHDDGRRTALLHRGDGDAMGRYLERYIYDPAGNFEEMQHRGSDPDHPGWTRTYEYSEPSQTEAGKKSNRLTGTRVGAGTETYSIAGDGYDSSGNMLRMPQLEVMQWDFANQLRMTRRQALNAADAEGTERHGERTWYVYDSGGQRVRKVTERAGAGPAGSAVVKEERIYLGGFEIHRRNGTAPLVRETLHVMDDTQRIALVETRVEGIEPGIPRQLVRYQLGNHLGSAGLELDDEAQIISYEEYSPYGSTTYQAVRNPAEAPKRYRYTGKERDEESGFTYHGARYYAPWVARWTNPDPASLADGSNLFVYCRLNPIVLQDQDGRQATRETRCQIMSPTMGVLVPGIGLECNHSGAIPDPPPAPPSAPSPTAASSLPPIDTSWEQPHGFAYAAREDALREINDSSNSWWSRGILFGLATLATPLALAEEYIGRSVLNIPHHASVAGQYWARASLQEGEEAASQDRAQAVSHMTFGALLPALSLVAPVAGALENAGGRAVASGATGATAAPGRLLAGEGAQAVDEAVVANQQAWAHLTRNDPAASLVFESGQNLAGASQLTIIGHGASREAALFSQGLTGAETIGLGGLGRVGPNTLAETLAQSGWRGGHIRLLSCSTGLPSTCGVIFGEQLSLSLGAQGLPTVVSAPRGLVMVGSELFNTSAPAVMYPTSNAGQGISVFLYWSW